MRASNPPVRAVAALFTARSKGIKNEYEADYVRIEVCLLIGRLKLCLQNPFQPSR